MNFNFFTKFTHFGSKKCIWGRFATESAFSLWGNSKNALNTSKNTYISRNLNQVDNGDPPWPSAVAPWEPGSTSFVRVCLQGHRAVGFPNHGVARIARYSHRAVVCCSQSPQQDYQNTLGGIQGRHHWQRPGKMNSERLAWLNWAALATTEPNLLWAGSFFCMGFYSGIFSDPAGSFFVLVFTAGSFPIPFPIPRDLFLYGFLQWDLFRSCFKHIIFILL